MDLQGFLLRRDEHRQVNVLLLSAFFVKQKLSEKNKIIVCLKNDIKFWLGSRLT
jgi:hypothetical protein